MITLTDYHVDQLIYEGKNSIVYQGCRKSDEQPVIIKTLKDTYPPPSTLARFEREFDVSHGLNPSTTPDEALQNVIATYAMEQDNQTWFIVFEDFGGQSLRSLEIAGNLSLTEFLALAVDIVDVVGQVHQKHVIHKDINPANIVWNKDTNQVKLIDFGISTRLSREITTFRNPNVLEGTLAYISPEQTGRMNRAIDYRTDFYSLGVTLYELLTGRLPFEDEDFMALIHAQIAKQPAPPVALMSKANAEEEALAQIASNIIMKLMAKNAEARYQSAYGLKSDLEQLLQTVRGEARAEQLTLGSRDISDQFQTSQKLYGRDTEVETLLNGFERTKMQSELMLVAGYSGIGKSVLVQEVYKPITAQNGYFISGKFDQFQRDIPYASMLQAFQSLIQQLLTESAEQLAVWREKLSQALGSNGRVMTDVIPELSLIIGEQTAVSELPPAEAQNRFNFTLQNFIKVFTQPEHPLVIFLDDLQWADGASLNLIKLLMTAPDSQHLYLLGAYRDNEVTEAHPLMLTIAAIKETEAAVEQITLAPLELAHIADLTADTLNQAPSKVQPLAELVLTKTNGNPFFINEFLKSLHQQKLITFDYEAGSWRWDLQAIQSQNMTDNVVELMTDKIGQLPAPTQSLLQLAACIGNRFDLETLAIVSETSPQTAASDLWASIEEGFVLPLSDDYQLASLDVENLLTDVTIDYKFAHDRMQQAVYTTIPEAEKAQTHARIGQLLLANLTEAEQTSHIFDLVNHLNKGQQGDETQADLDRLARYNLTAGQKAKASAAYEPAHAYFQKGLELIGEDSWDRDYDLTLGLFTEGVETASLTGDIEAMEGWADEVFAQAKQPVEKAAIADIKALNYIGQGKLLDAVELTLEALAMLGIDIPQNPTQEEIGAKLMETFPLWQGKEIADFVNLPEMTDPEKRMALQIISTVFAGTYSVAPGLVPMFSFTMTDLSIKYGNAPASTFGYASYALMLCGVVGDYDSGYEFGQMALKLVDKLNVPLFKSRVDFYMGIFVIHWKRHLRESLDPALKAYQIALETGDLSNAFLSAMLHCYHAYVAGNELTQLAETFERYMDPMAQAKQDFALLYQKLWAEPIFSLMGKSENIGMPDYEGYYNQIEPVMYEQQFFPAIWSLHLNRGILAYIFQEYDFALEQFSKAEPYIETAVGAITGVVFTFYNPLLRLALYSDQSEADKEATMAVVDASLEKYKTWAEHAPMNFQHKYDLIAAEKARALGDVEAAIDSYERAIQGARENDYIQEQALAYELAAQFYLGRGLEKIGHTYLHEARYLYQQWGASVKVSHLEEKYPQLRGTQSVVSSGGTTVQMTTTASGASQRITSQLDLTSVLKASQTLSGEIVLNKLLERMMGIIIENAGAQHGFLILPKGDQWFIEAEGHIDQAPVNIQSIELSESSAVSAGIVNYVIRTQGSVVLSDALNDGAFTEDTYVVAQKPKSILCMPLINQGKLTSVLYLENNLTSDAFTQDRVDLLNLLSSQAAISIENATLYNTLEEKVIERTAQLAAANDEITALNERLKEENLRLEAELDVAKQLQQMLLPKTEELAQIAPLDIAGFMEPADEVGGDYYDVLQRNGRIKIGIGDVTGHGLESGVVMLMTQMGVRTLLNSDESDPVRFMDVLNRTIYENGLRMENQRNLSLSLLEYIPANSGSLAELKISGQHEEVIVIRKDGSFELLDTADLGFPVGLDDEIADFIAETSITLDSGDGVVLYTDGFTEAENVDRQFYGLERVCEIASQNWAKSASEIQQAIVDDVTAFIGEQTIYDDLTLVVIKQH